MTTPETNAAIQQIADSVERIANVVDKIDVGWQSAMREANNIFDFLKTQLEDPDWSERMGKKFAQAFRLGMMGM